MPAFSRLPSFRSADRSERMGLALDEPFGVWEAVGENIQQGMLDTFGLGTAVRDFTSGGNLVPNAVSSMPNVPIVGDFVRGAVQGAYGLRDALNPDESPVLTEDEYKASPHYRDVIPWDQGMTENRAQSLAEFADQRAVRQHFSEKQPIAAFIGQFGGQAFDPVNYVPVFGPAARVAAVARFGSIGGRALLGASEAAVNTAAFGVLTANIREKLGDDVSFAAIGAEVAMSALIGGAFGTGIGVFARGRDARARVAEGEIREAMRDVRHQQEASIALNEAIDSLARTGDVDLTPNAIQPIEKARAEVAERTSAARSLEAETAGVSGTKAGEVAINSQGMRVAVRPEVVELDTLVQAEGKLQVRDRRSAVSDAQVEDIAINLDAARLMPAVNSDSGAPIVGPDNIIDSGNGRVRGIERAAQAYPEKFAAYRKAIEDAGYSTEGMRNPVLISRRTTPLSEEARAQFNADSQGSTAEMSAVEIAQMDRAALDDGVLQVLGDGPVNSAGNRPFVERFMSRLPQNQRGALLDQSGGLNADGVRRVENALVAAAYGDVDMVALRKFAEATDDNTRSIVGAMADVAGRWALMRRAMKSGEVEPEFDVTAELALALRSLSRWRDQAAREGRAVSTVIREGMAQLDLLDGAMPAEAQVFIRMFYRNDHFAAAVGREALAARLGRVIDSAYDLGRPQLFADTMPVSKGEMLVNAANDFEADIFAPVDVEPGAQGNRPGGIGTEAAPDSGANRQGTGEGQARNPAADVAAARDFKAAQPARSIDDLYAIAPAHQETLGALGESLAEKHGVEFRDPGIKSREASAEKMVRKGYESTQELTDVVRGGFVVDTPASADALVADIADQYPILDEGWRMTVAGYFDRKIMVQMPDGTLAEVQFWHPDMLDAKDARGGHALYEAMRGLKPDDPKFADLLDQQRALYREAAKTVSEPWRPILDQLDVEAASGGRPASGNASSNAASESGVPDSTTSAASASRQSPPDAGRNQADEPDMIAGLDSQSKNMASIAPDMAVSATQGKPDPVPEGLPEAEARVGRGENPQELAEQFGVDPETGASAEVDEVATLREGGRLTPEDEADLAAADQEFVAAQAYDDVLRVAAVCDL